MDIFETHDSREFGSKSAKLQYMLGRDLDEQTALSLLFATFPISLTDTAGNIYKNPDYILSPLRGGWWQADITYTREGPFNGLYEPGLDDALTSDTGITIDISPNSYKLFQSIETLDAVHLDLMTAPPLFNRAINVNRGKVDGVELGNAAFVINIQRTRDITTLRYIRKLKELQYTVNTLPFFGFAEGEVLFLGATGSSKDGKPYVFDYKFGIELNKEYFEVADGLVFAGKRGWDYVWCMYSDDVDENVLVQTPIAAYMEQVFDYTDFTFLDL